MTDQTDSEDKDSEDKKSEIRSNSTLTDEIRSNSTLADNELISIISSNAFTGQVVCGYTLGRILNQGGMGAVYFGLNIHLEPQNVAVKIILPFFMDNNEKLKRFEREAKLSSRLDHPNIIKVIGVDFVKSEGKELLAIVMEYVEGEDLKKALLKNRFSSFNKTMISDIMIPLCQGLKALHDKGIVHRDLKTSNIMIGSKRQLKIIDLGLARSTECTTLTAETRGTYPYMSPEQFEDMRTVTKAADLYSLGIIFFEIITGRRPFNGPSPPQFLYQHISQPPPKPKQYKEDLPDWINHLILKLLGPK